MGSTRPRAGDGATSTTTRSAQKLLRAPTPNTGGPVRHAKAKVCPPPRPPPASRGQSPGSAGDSVVLNVPRRTETAQENGISADFCFAACKIFSCEYIHIIPYLSTDVLWEYC